MSTQQEELVKTPEPKSIREHYEDAKKAAQSEEDHGGETETPKPDDTSTPPAEEPAKPADQTEETGESEDTLLTAEEVGKLNPKERSLYEKAQKNYTLKTQKLAAERKEMESWKPLIESLKADPQATLDAIAKQYGFTLSKPNQDTTAKEQAKDIVDQLPEELAFLEKPLEARIQKAIDQRLKPLEERDAQRAADAASAETNATLAEFDAKYPDWKKHEPAMLKIMADLVPTANMTAFKFMEVAYRSVKADISEAESTKKVIAKIEKSAAASESASAGIPAERVVHKRPPNATLRDAYQAAKRGEVWED